MAATHGGGDARGLVVHSESWNNRVFLTLWSRPQGLHFDEALWQTVTREACN